MDAVKCLQLAKQQGSVGEYGDALALGMFAMQRLRASRKGRPSKMLFEAVEFCSRCSMDLNSDENTTLALLKESKSLAYQLYGDDSHIWVETNITLGSFYLKQSDFGLAAVQFATAMRSLNRTQSGDTEQHARIAYASGCIHMKLGKYEIALAMYQKARRIFDTFPYSMYTIMLYLALAKLYILLERYEVAYTLIWEQVLVSRAIYGTQSLIHADALANMSEMYNLVTMIDESKRCAEEAREIYKSVLKTDSFSVTGFEVDRCEMIRCSECYTIVEPVAACATCGEMAYCSEECCAAHWERLHKYVCKRN